MDPGKKLIEGFLFGWLFIFLPVYVGKTPEKSAKSQIFGHLEILSTVFTLRGSIELVHGFTGDLLIQVFYIF